MTDAVNNSYLLCEGISKAWKDRHSLRNVHLSVNQNERLAVVGENGAGKTTLLRVLAGLEKASGRILLQGRAIPEYSDKESPIGIVFQQPVIYPHLSVQQNLSFPLERRKKSRQEIEARIGRVADLLDLSKLMNLPAGRLSAGEMQHVSIGRVLAHPPKVLLLDEPFANLHRALRWRMIDYLRELHREFSLTTILVTHEPQDAMYFADRIAVMSDGRILQLGSVEEVIRAPASLEVAQLLFDPPPNVMPWEQSTVMAWRPADTKINQPSPTIASQTVCLKGEVRNRGHYEDQILLSIGIADVVVRALVRGENCPKVGEIVELQVEKSKTWLFGRT